MQDPAPRNVVARRLLWAAVWLAVILIAIKAYYLGAPHVRPAADLEAYLRSLAAISYEDVLFATVLWVVARIALMPLGRYPRTARAVHVAFLIVAAICCAYALASVIVFGVFGGFVTYPLLALVGDVRMLSSSAGTYLTPWVVAGLVALLATYIGLALATPRVIARLDSAAPGQGSSRTRGLVGASLGLWLVFGHYAFATDWATKQDRKIAENSQWVLISSWWEVVSGADTVRMADHFPAGDLADFAPLGVRRPPSPAAVLRRIATPARAPRTGRVDPPRPMNVIVVVLESVGARWTGLSGGVYDTTPNLNAESAHALVLDNFYAHIGRSSNSLAAMLLSAYPKLDFRDFTDEFPKPNGTPLPTVFRDRGYRTAFMMPSYLSWAGWGTFLQGSGFGEMHDSTDFPCAEVSSWGVEDRCMVDAMAQWIDRDPTRPFFMLGWTDQTHHPYEPTPGVPLLNLLREPGPDDYDLGHYLNVLHETDRHLERLFETIRRDGLADNTMVVVVGDHGQAFGSPHNEYGQGSAVYEEDVHVPFMIWSPRLYPTGKHSPTLASHVDLAPTIAELAGLPAAPDWQGRSLFDSSRSPRAYFYVAEDHFALGVREGNWKYIFDLREGAEELYDLAKDPLEQHSVAKAEPALSARFRQRLAAWTEANRRQYTRGPAAK
jgi:arylsulfatase A-like enzyme